MKLEYIDGVTLKKMIIKAAEVLKQNKGQVDALNVFPVPDGDTGTNMALTMESAVKELYKLKTSNLNEVAEKVANGSLMGARGNSGVILSQIFRGFAKGVENKNTINSFEFAEALRIGSDFAYKAVLKPVEGTILTVVRECAKRAVQLARSEKNIIKIIEGIINHGEKTVQKTSDMLPVLKEAGVVDAGAQGFIFILKGFFESLITDYTSKEEEEKSFKTETSYIPVEDKNLKFLYCTEILLKGKDLNVDEIKKDLSEMGNSILVVGSDNLIKIHIHSNHPGNVIEKCLKMGELVQIKIDNMKEQHRSFLDMKKQNKNKNIGIVAVSSGEGFEEILANLGVDTIIEGGQTMNPSTEELVQAIQKTNAESIIVLPNNSNIILAAKQAKEISEKQVVVIPTKNIPQSITALLAFNLNDSIDVNKQNMIRAIENVKTGEITFAVRDSKYNGFRINKGDYIGLVDGEIHAVGKDMEKIVFSLFDEMVTETSEIITIFYGKDVNETEAKILFDKLQAKYPECEIELHFGGQPLYYYVFSVE
ncbi:MAG: fatty acid kinase [Thermosediminibacterales bacterium]|nr:fatty acid kinase [Thermosediminibacterales bacterium]MDK2835439.1 fatty acid kinase [Thermosediminibacterales bacterium]